MRTLDRYMIRQLFPVWIWCVMVFVFIVCLVDLFGRLDEIIAYHIPAEVVLKFYANFVPIVIVWSAPLSILVASAFVAMRLARYQEFLAMKAGGLSLARSAAPFLFTGWLVSILIFGINEVLVPRSSSVYEQLRAESFKAQPKEGEIKNVTTVDATNRLYHARRLEADSNELLELTVLEHDEKKLPKRTIYARRALFTDHGWLLLYGNINRIDRNGFLGVEPEPFLERLFNWPVNIDSFRMGQVRAETMTIGELRKLIGQLRGIGIENVRSYRVDLAAKISLPFCSFIMCLIGFIGPIRRYTRGHMQGLGASLLLGIAYYLFVATSQGLGKQGMLPVIAAVWLPHIIALGLCARALKRAA